MSYKQMTGNIISATKVEPVGTSEAGAASGVWNLDDVYDYNRGANWPEAGVPDPDTLIENNFSTTLYTGNGGTQTITNGIDLAGKGGLVWVKSRNYTYGHALSDTEHTVGNYMSSNTTDPMQNGSNAISAFSSTGFSLGNDAYLNDNNSNIVSWTFKKASKFFDIVNYTGNSTNRTISHNLGSVPGMIIVKLYSEAGYSWQVYHRSLANTERIELDNTGAKTTGATNYWNSTTANDSVFSIGTHDQVNKNGASLVAYVFAHETGADSMIQCGSYTGNGSATGPVINLGWEPQWLLIRNADRADDWVLIDSMRGIPTSSAGPAVLRPESSAVEYAPGSTFSQASRVDLTGVGFDVKSGNSRVNGSNQNMIYVAIRRPNMATITDATEVFAVNTYGSNRDSSATDQFFAGFTIDMQIRRNIAGNADLATGVRLIGINDLDMNNTNAERTDETNNTWDSNTSHGNAAGTSTNSFSWMWKRAKGYFDVVAYTGNGTPSNTVRRDLKHNLGVAPELAILKRRNTTSEWQVAADGKELYLNLTLASQGTYTPSSHFNATDFDVEGWVNEANNNVSGSTYIVYLFATLDGISKVGSVSHSGSSTDVDCGFSAGARFVLLKRTDATGDWYFWDSVRGIIAGNDPYLLMNEVAAQVTNTDFIDPLASGFQISGNFTDGDYIFYAIA